MTSALVPSPQTHHASYSNPTTAVETHGYQLPPRTTAVHSDRTTAARTHCNNQTAATPLAVVAERH